MEQHEEQANNQPVRLSAVFFFALEIFDSGLRVQWMILQRGMTSVICVTKKSDRIQVHTV